MQNEPNTIFRTKRIVCVVIFWTHTNVRIFATKSFTHKLQSLIELWEIYDSMSTPNSTCCLRFENIEGVQKVYYLQQEKVVTLSSLFLREANDDTIQMVMR